MAKSIIVVHITSKYCIVSCRIMCTFAATPRSTWSHSEGALYLAHQLSPLGW